jgi:hypothetical protein
VNGTIVRAGGQLLSFAGRAKIAAKRTFAGPQDRTTVHSKLTRRHAAACMAVVLCAVGGVHAATPDAWVDYEREVTAACIGASGLTDAKPAGKLVDFDDRLGVGAIVIQGEYPQKHMKNAQGRVLCLFHKKTRTPYISVMSQP